MLDDIARIEADAAPRIAAAATLDDVRTLDAELLGKRSPLSALKGGLGGLSPEERKEAGAALNRVRAALEGALAARRAELEAVERASKLEAERLDLTEVPLGLELRCPLHRLQLRSARRQRAFERGAHPVEIGRAHV